MEASTGGGRATSAARLGPKVSTPRHPLGGEVNDYAVCAEAAGRCDGLIVRTDIGSSGSDAPIQGVDRGVLRTCEPGPVRLRGPGVTHWANRWVGVVLQRPGTWAHQAF